MKSEIVETNAVALKTASFLQVHSCMRFHQIEAQFTIQNPVITDDNTKFAYLLSALPADIAVFMEFAVEKATEGDRYCSLKAALIKQFGLTKAQKAKNLASFTTLDLSITPTMLLEHMCSLSSDSTTEEFFHQFKSVMGSAVRATLAGRKFENIKYVQRLLMTWLRPPRSVPMYIWLGVHPK